tara:strand:- start:193 stop:840 length:648 start_codon:yes stop_codon:yes gene_type:complete
MVYFLGRDVVVALTSEDSADFIISTSGAPAYQAGGAYGGGTLIAGPRKDNAGSGTTVFGTQTDNSNDYSNEIASLTGCDLSIGATDEDVVYFGQRTALKAEIKKETSITLTRKKEDDSWEVCFNGARSGIDSAGTGIRSNIAGAPDDVNYGYRVYVKLKNSSEVFVLRNCCVTGHSVSLNVDGITEETLELMSYVDPIIKSADADCLAATSAGDI